MVSGKILMFFHGSSGAGRLPFRFRRKIRCRGMERFQKLQCLQSVKPAVEGLPGGPLPGGKISQDRRPDRIETVLPQKMTDGFRHFFVKFFRIPQCFVISGFQQKFQGGEPCCRIFGQGMARQLGADRRTGAEGDPVGRPRRRKHQWRRVFPDRSSGMRSWRSGWQ